ncbi:hypothetical protein QRZ34_27375 [Klebsiella michiganensis]|uniref:hypothetical protein n=1 Tax=Klebsiella michiganensis TaxID=1134687 RepID=UPI002570BB14|nr:hypothetical protein [Klebsiella michiganensis]MDL4454760.1 hypothetical protein [Klebsiella michiganensis]
MAIKISSEKMTPITLNDFVLYLETSGAIETLSNSVSSPSIMSATAMQLRALAANKAHILSFVVNELEKSEHFQQQNNDQPQSFVLHRTPLYTIRLMLWIPSGHQAKSIPFSYEVAHDHVFDLMTVGFLVRVIVLHCMNLIIMSRFNSRMD